ncbi:MAG: hypothetical protein NVS2B16_04700 [Chloroflexota bacterium]
MGGSLLEMGTDGEWAQGTRKNLRLSIDSIGHWYGSKRSHDPPFLCPLPNLSKPTNKGSRRPWVAWHADTTHA